VWLKGTPDADYQYLGARGLIERHIDWVSEPVDVATEQQLPERQGLFGLLSVGFAAAAVLTVLGFLLYALFSFRRRVIEFGVLRAVGLSSGQMGLFLGWELAFLILMGGGLGTLLGSGVSNFFIPFLQVGGMKFRGFRPMSWTLRGRRFSVFTCCSVGCSWWPSLCLSPCCAG